MPGEVTRDQVQELLTRGGQLVDMLPADEYAEQHLAGAINIPLKQLDVRTTAALRKDAPVMVYCHDLQ